jgi:hypothetical protein
MHDVRAVVEAVNAAIDLTTIFQRFQIAKDIPLKDADFRVVLPYLFLNPGLLRSFSVPVQKSAPLCYRLNCMRELFEAGPDGAGPANFEDCESNAQRLALLRADLALLAAGQRARAFRLSQYEQFLADALSVLYARFAGDYPLPAFLHAAFAAGDCAVLSLCFAFPHFLCAAFRLALARGASARLLCCLCGLSPCHRPILLQKLVHLPVHFALLSLRFFPDESPLILTATLETGVSGMKEELAVIRKRDNPLHLFWLCYARCCASDAIMSERDVELFEYCHDDRLFVSGMNV